MIRPAFLLPLLLAACVSTPAPLPPPDAEVRPVVQKDRLEGRWMITAVNGQAVQGYWLEFGAEGPVREEPYRDGTLIRPPTPQTRAHIGANDWSSMGWVRIGDKLRIVGGMQTERGFSDPVLAAQEEQAGRILRLPMTMEITPPTSLRLINEAGTLDLVRMEGVK
jgi:hypothetical protein